jgi:predicted metal-binding protein
MRDRKPDIVFDDFDEILKEYTDPILIKKRQLLKKREEIKKEKETDAGL